MTANVRSTPDFTPYEQEVLRQIAHHHVHPNAVQRLLDTLGKPFGRFLKAGRESRSQVIRGLSDQVQHWIEDGLIRTIRTGNRFVQMEDVLSRHYEQGHAMESITALRSLPLEDLDRVADSYKFSGSFAIGIEGAFMGGLGSVATGIPGAQLLIPSIILTDIASSMTLLSRHVCHISSCYGYASMLPQNLPHLVAAMAPHSETSDEGYLALKTAVAASISESSQFIARTAGMLIDRHVLEREAPQMVRLVAYVAERLGIVVTQKELGILVPIAGAALNSSINVAFQQVGHAVAKDYFRRLVLEERYGDEAIAFALGREFARIQDSTRSG